MRGDHRPLIGVLDQNLYRGGELIAGGVGACGEEPNCELTQLLLAELVAVLLGADQVGEQIVGESPAPPFHHGVDVVLELAPSRHDGGFVFGDVPVEHLEDVVSPFGEQLPVLAGCTEQSADDWNRVLPCDVVDDIALAGDCRAIDELGDDVANRGGQAGSRFGGEGLRDQLALSVVRVAVETQQSVDDAVPQRARGDALGGQPEPAWRRKTVVSQTNSSQLVGKQFRSMRSRCDGRLA